MSPELTTILGGILSFPLAFLVLYLFPDLVIGFFEDTTS